MNSAQVINISPNESLLKMEIEDMRHQLLRVQMQLSELMKRSIPDHFMVYNSGEYRRVSVYEIIQIASTNNYSTFYLDDGSKILTSRTLKYWEETINHPDLVRIHHSSLINKCKIKTLNIENSEIILSGNITTRYSRMSKSELLNKLA